MKSEELKNLTNINNKNELFQIIIRKLTLNEELIFDEKSYILEIALNFINYYNKDNKYTTYLEFAYYIIVKYSITYSDYRPLYDFSTEFGFFPISKYILDNKLLQKFGISDYLVNSVLESYKYNNEYIQTLEQNNTRLNLLNSDYKEIAFIAPTSYGKSSIIIDLIKKYMSTTIKIAVIVPTKSLLLQTYKMIKSANFNKRLFIHDDMYTNENSFISIFTQERALRLLSNKNIYFDILFIDEAHNLFVKDSRAILLSRLINRNSLRNPEHKVIYLSPLIDNKNNLMNNKSQIISEQRIHYNIKEPEIYEYRSDNYMYKYNRFINKFYPNGMINNYIEYIKTNSKNKNFIYLTKPVDIEEFSNEFVKSLPLIEGNIEIDELKEVLKENVHEDFYLISLIEKGLLYIHGQMPDLIKEYLEYKFKNINVLQYIIANKVILEGINLPIDNLYILNLHYLQGKDITNLIGRVNRLNEIFLNKNNTLHKLLPQIHFVNSKFGKKMTTKIELLRSGIFKDKVNNPILDAFSFDDLNKKIENAKNDYDKSLAEANKIKIENIQINEKYIQKASNNEFDKLKKYCIEHGIDVFTKNGNIQNRYNANFDDITYELIRKINSIKNNNIEWGNYNLLEKINHLFIKDFDVLEFEFKRLKDEETRKFYLGHIARSHQYNLKDNINFTYEYFLTRINDNNLSNDFYMGTSYGEFEKETREYKNGGFNVYVDLSNKSKVELINFAIIKLKIEDNFVSFTLSRFVEMMFEYELIDEEEYNLFIYGRKNLQYINLMRYGLNSNLISRLESDGQLENIDFDEYGNIHKKQDFQSFIENLNDDFYKFQLLKYI